MISGISSGTVKDINLTLTQKQRILQSAENLLKKILPVFRNEKQRGFFLFYPISLVKRRIEGVEILRVQAVGGQAERFTKALVMHDLPRAEEFDGVSDVGVVAHTEDFVVGHAGFLLGGEVFMKIGDGVSLGLHIRRRPRRAACRCRIYACRVIDIIRREAGIHDLFAAENSA